MDQAPTHAGYSWVDIIVPHELGPRSGCCVVLREFHAAEMEKTFEELPGQLRASGVFLLSMEIRLVERESSSFNLMGRWEGMH